VVQEPQAIVLEVAYAMSDAADLLGDPVLGFDRSGRDVPGVVAEHLFSQREIVVARRELCDVGCSDLGIEPHEPPVGFSQCRCEVAFAQQLLGQDGSGDLACGVACLERAEELVALAQVLSGLAPQYRTRPYAILSNLSSSNLTGERYPIEL
jgi:hypothetical protein